MRIEFHIPKVVMFRYAAFAFAGLAVLVGSASAETYDRKVRANTASPIGGFAGYEEETCRPSVIPIVKVRQPPANGTIKIEPYTGPIGSKTRCSTSTLRGLVYIYTPKKGFKGADEVVIDVPWATNDSAPPIDFTYTYRITVE
jgi:hypothetical protein